MIASACRSQFGFTPDQLLEMTFPQLRAVFGDPEELDEQARYRRMRPEVQAKAREMKRRYGRF